MGHLGRFTADLQLCLRVVALPSGSVNPASRLAKGSRMMVNPSLAKQKARTVCAVGLKLCRHRFSSAEATTANNRIQLTPAQIKQALAGFSNQDASHKSFLELNENRNLTKHISTLLQLLSVIDDPLPVQNDIVTQR